jgi:hypothetical protein
MIEELAAQGVGRSTAAPPVYRLAWRLGLRIPPPLYQSFGARSLGTGTGFALSYGLVMWNLVWRPDGQTPMHAIVLSLIAGALFGLFMGLFYRWKARSLRLPSID